MPCPTPPLRGRLRSPRRLPQDRAARPLQQFRSAATRCGFWLLAATLVAGPALSHISAAPPAEGGKPKHTNRLAGETSPYLLLHAHNPVDWYPWGPEALAKAKRENKLIFLSVGYSSCYWCHVMERESFMDDEIAAFLNKHFVCIKVDREERPDIDEIYMMGLQVYHHLIGSSQGGGWPLSMFLTPDGQPLGGGTYFPPRTRQPMLKLNLLAGVYQMPQARMDGFLEVIARVQSAWENNREQVQAAAEHITDLVRAQLRRRPEPLPLELGEPLLKRVDEALAGDFDPRYGGFSYNPDNDDVAKFPEPSNLLYLLQRAKAGQGDHAAAARKMLLTTLDRMAAGGIRDHIGGGFHRYSVDRYWRVPHFEKMLYDNGQLASVYAEVFALTGDERYRRVVDELASFVLREMTSPQGGFYSALDAETEAQEGRYYIWHREELEPVTQMPGYRQFARVYGLDRQPNFEGAWVLEQVVPLEQVAKEAGMNAATLRQQLSLISSQLMKLRGERERPLLDTKILAAWNGMMIRGLADAGRILKRQQYLDAAAKAADFVLKSMRTEDGRLYRTHTAGEARLNAYLDDYANVVDGLLALYRATGEKRWLEAADALTAKQIELFWDDEHGGFFYTSADHEELIVRSRGPVDAAVPSGNSVAAINLLTLSRELGNDDYRAKAEATIKAHGPILRQAPQAMTRLAIAVAVLASK